MYYTPNTLRLLIEGLFKTFSYSLCVLQVPFIPVCLSGDPCLTAYTSGYRNKKLMVNSVCMACIIGYWASLWDDLAGLYLKESLMSIFKLITLYVLVVHAE